LERKVFLVCLVGRIMEKKENRADEHFLSSFTITNPSKIGEKMMEVLINNMKILKCPHLKFYITNNKKKSLFPDRPLPSHCRRSHSLISPL